MDPADIQRWLETFVGANEGAAGTVHAVSADDPDLLELAASFRIPAKVVERTRRIPRGKGMAGLALLRGQPVQTCNLQSDTSGDVRPGAKAVPAQAAVALPARREGKVFAIVGIAYADERELNEDTLASLTAAADTCPDVFS